MSHKDVPSVLALVSRAPGWRRWSAERAIVLTAVTSAAVATVGLVAFWGLRASHRADSAVEHTRDVLEAGYHHLLGLVDAETGQRGFVLTGDEAFLEPYQQGIRQSVLARRQLKLLTIADDAQQERLAALDSLAIARIASSAATIAVRRAEGAAAAAAMVSSGQGKRLMDDTRSITSAILMAERGVLSERQAEERKSESLALWLVAGGTGLSLLLTILSGTLLARAIGREQRFNTELAAAAARLQDSSDAVQRVNDEVQLANEELEATNEELHTANAELAAANAGEEHARRASEADRSLLRAVVDGTPDSVFVKDTACRYVLANAAAARVLGGTPGSVIGRSDEELFPPEIAAWLIPQDRRIMESGAPEVVEEHVEVAGQPRWFLTTKSPWLDERGKILGLIGVARDITERRAVEDRLRQVQRLEAVGRLAGGVAHEVNNQMTVVLGSAEFILGRGDLPGGVKEDVQMVRQAASRAAAITGQLLAYSRRQFIQPQAVDLTAAIQRFEPVLRRTMGELHTLELRLGTDLRSVQADPGQIEQILLNLAINAVDAMPRGGTMSIATTNINLTERYTQMRPDVAVPPGPYVALVVSDTGHGMDRDTLSHAFEPFFTTKGVGKGTGLGLSTVYGIVKQSAGFVWLYSEPGRGTSVKIYLPAAVEEPRTVYPPEPEMPRAQASEGVLVVDDDPEVRAIAVRVLQETGYRVVEGSNGREALEIVRAQVEPLDLVVTDLAMPEMDGRELALELATLRPTLPILLMSGYTDDEVVRRGLVSDGLWFLQKPFSPSGLASKVREVLDVAAR